ncbi:MAG: SipW-dependent-type signal peptide-containing protein [Salinirussus sp.]
MDGSDPQIYDLTRRKVLGGLTAVGLASAGAGLGTGAYFSDEETFKNNRLVAGELDLLVDFQEHYSDWSADEADAVGDIRMAREGTLTEGDYPSDYTGLPVANDAMIAIPTGDLGAFMDTTAIDAFPDTNDDAIQDTIPPSDECGFLRQEGYLLGEDGGHVSALDSAARTSAHQGDPLVALSDVKPGDFGEVTFSLHLCDNPGYLWMTGDLVANDEVRVTEPEADDPDEDQTADDPENDFDGELAQKMQAAAWYDTGRNGTFFETEDPDTERNDEGEGDNVRQDFDDDESEDPQPNAPERLIAKGSLVDVLAILDREPGWPLDAEPSTLLDEGDPPEGPTASPDSGRTLSGSAESSEYLCCATVGGNPKCTDLGLFSALKLDEGEDLPESDALPQTFQTPAGEVTIEDHDIDAGTVTISTDFGVAAVITKGGPNARVCEADADGDGNILEEGDEVKLSKVTFQTPINPNNDKPYGLSHVQVCYRTEVDDEPPVPPQGDGERECFPASDTAHIGFAWWLPIEVGNEIQADSVAFNLGFYAEQCRHNDGSGMPPEE